MGWYRRLVSYDPQLHFLPTILYTAMERNITPSADHTYETVDDTLEQELNSDDLAHVAGGGETAYNAGKAVGDAIEDAWDWCVNTVSGWFD